MGGMFRKYPRASWHDYNCGLYFVTVCTSQHKYYFGQIRDGEIELSSLGKYLCGAIEQAGLHYPYITIDTYVVMPNHFHVIMIVLETGLDMPEKSVADVNTGCVAAPCHSEESGDFSLRHHFNARLSRAVGGIKSAVTKFAHERAYEFAWQPNFHDHIIRNQREYDFIANYIATNVENWQSDRYAR